MNNTVLNERKQNENRIDPLRIVEAYKYYFQKAPQQHIGKLILANQRICEYVIFQSRVKYRSKSHKVFFDYLCGESYISLSSKYNLPLYVVTNTIFQCRLKLIEGIEGDVFDKKLHYTPLLDKKTFKMAQFEFCSEYKLVNTLNKLNKLKITL